jgi:hypothetical protein
VILIAPDKRPKLLDNRLRIYVLEGEIGISDHANNWGFMVLPCALILLVSATLIAGRGNMGWPTRRMRNFLKNLPKMISRA